MLQECTWKFTPNDKYIYIYIYINIKERCYMSTLNKIINSGKQTKTQKSPKLWKLT